MDALQELVLLEVERLASIGYANNIQKEAINTASFSQAVDKCRNCMSQQPVLMRKSAKNVII
ncbi:MAG: hypothetical protein E7G68_03260 [Gemella haemolysans]|nr:hypothetical protein [Gemella haemolysans]